MKQRDNWPILITVGWPAAVAVVAAVTATATAEAAVVVPVVVTDQVEAGVAIHTPPPPPLSHLIVQLHHSPRTVQHHLSHFIHSNSLWSSVVIPKR